MSAPPAYETVADRRARALANYRAHLGTFWAHPVFKGNGVPHMVVLWRLEGEGGALAPALVRTYEPFFESVLGRVAYLELVAVVDETK